MKIHEMKTDCNHCWHRKRGPVMMVVADGHTVSGVL
jgi:hypothetical protein